jgi:hypothetical protein
VIREGAAAGLAQSHQAVPPFDSRNLAHAKINKGTRGGPRALMRVEWARGRLAGSGDSPILG